MQNKKQPNKPKPVRKQMLEMPWQKGEYARKAEFSFMLPYPFLLLCKVLDITPAQLLTDFMDDLGCGSWNREGRDEAKVNLIEYFIARGYGQPMFSVEEIRRIFRELDAIGLLWPTNSPMELIELTSKWRKEYYNYWFEKWQTSQRRQS